MIERRTFLAAVSLATLAGLQGCGFRPLLARPDEESSVAAQLAAIRVQQIGSGRERRLGQILRNELTDRFTAGVGPQPVRYDLDVEISQKSEAWLIQTTSTVTRYNLILDAEFELRDAGTGEPLYRSTARSVGAHDVVRSEYATEVARQDTAHKAALGLADTITHLLLLYLDRESGQDP